MVSPLVTYCLLVFLRNVRYIWEGAHHQISEYTSSKVFCNCNCVLAVATLLTQCYQGYSSPWLNVSHPQPKLGYHKLKRVNHQPNFSCHWLKLGHHHIPHLTSDSTANFWYHFLHCLKFQFLDAKQHCAQVGIGHPMPRMAKGQDDNRLKNSASTIFKFLRLNVLGLVCYKYNLMQ